MGGSTAVLLGAPSSLLFIFRGPKALRWQQRYPLRQTHSRGAPLGAPLSLNRNSSCSSSCSNSSSSVESWNKRYNGAHQRPLPIRCSSSRSFSSSSSSSSSSNSSLVVYGHLRDRWFVAYKPPGWSVGPHRGAPSLQEALEDALGRQRLSAACEAAAAAAAAAPAAAPAAAAAASIESSSLKALFFPLSDIPLQAQGLVLVATDEAANNSIRNSCC